MEFIPFLFLFALMVVAVAGMWMTFEKAGQPGIACIVPIWNVIALCQIAGKPIWWVLLFLIPLVNIVVAVIVHLEIARNFGRSELFGIGLVLLPFIFFCVLGFGDARYLAGKSGK